MILNREFNVGGVFTVLLPEMGKASYLDNSETVSIELGESINPIYVKKYSLGKSFFYRNTKNILKKEMHRFINTGVKKAINRDPAYSIAEGEVNGYLYSQGLVHSENYSWWIIRAIARVEDADYFLLHWTGNKSDMRDVLAVLTSFEFKVNPHAKP